MTGLHSGLFTHLNDSMRIMSEHVPLEGRDPVVIFALYAVQCHAVLRLDHPVLASVGHRRTVRFIWGETVISVYITYSQFVHR